MDEKTLLVKKYSGDLELFSIEKLKSSLQVCGVSKTDIDGVLKAIEPRLYDGISSNKIHKMVFPLLKKKDRVQASKYNLKRAIFDLGPTGCPFERMVGALLNHRGYKTEIGVVLKGECITHEIDVLAEKDGNVYAIECKFHSKPDYSSNVRIPLYINSRFLDVQKQWNSNTKNKTHLKQGWLVTNTRFTDDALNYAKCVGLTLLSWDYPKDSGMSKNIDKFGLYPITALTTLTKLQKDQLITRNVILTKELGENPDILKQLKISPVKIKRILSEVHQLCNM